MSSRSLVEDLRRWERIPMTAFRRTRESQGNIPNDDDAPWSGKSMIVERRTSPVESIPLSDALSHGFWYVSQSYPYSEISPLISLSVGPSHLLTDFVLKYIPWLYLHYGLDHARERQQEGLVGRFMDNRGCPLRIRNAKSQAFVQLLHFWMKGNGLPSFMTIVLVGP